MIIGIFLSITSFVDLNISATINATIIKISATIIFIGFVIILMIDEKNTHTAINDIQLILIIILLTLVSLIITINTDFDIFIILIIISTIVLKELLNKFLSPHLQKRMNLLFYILLILFVIIVVQRIINISSMYPS
jgi:hypothetical protein